MMADLRPVQGLYYEDYIVGASITSQGRTVTESDIVRRTDARSQPKTLFR